MNKLVFKNLLPLSISIFVMICISLLWKKISIPLHIPSEIEGEYKEYNHHHLNDTLRFVLIVVLSLLSYVVSFALVHKNSNSIKELIFNRSFEKIAFKTNKKQFPYIIFFLIILIVNFVSTDLPTYKLDIFHEGQLLSGAINSNLKSNFWLGSYLNTGLFYDILNTKFAWKIFGVESIGSYRIFQVLLNYIFIFFTILLSYKLSKIFNLDEQKEIYFFFILSIFLIYNYNISYPNFPNYRDICSIIFLILLINTFFKQNFINTNFFFIGNLCFFSLLWSLDRGVFLNATFLFVIILLIIKKKYLNVISSILGFGISCLIFIYFIGFIEFKEFFNNSINILKYNEIWNGLIHPQPFSGEKNSTRATKAIILIILNGIIISNYFLNKNNNLFFNSKIILLVFYLMGIFYYKIGLSRSDGGHIVIGASINTILFSTLLIQFIMKNEIINKLLNYFPLRKIIFLLFLPVIFILLSFNELKINKLDNILNFKHRLKEFVNFEDKYFVRDEYFLFINELNKLLINQNCIQTINYDPTIYYFLKKESCTKYYYTFILGTKNDQKNFIRDLEIKKPKILVYKDKKDTYKYSPEKRFKIINDYINKNYKDFTTISNFKLILLKSE